jgi:hypothetical protein
LSIERRRSARWVAVFVLMLAVIVAETLLLSGRLMGPEIRNTVHPGGVAARADTVLPPLRDDVLIRLQNVRFLWSAKVYIDAGDMAVRAIPNTGNTVDFDDLSSFRLALQRSVVTITPEVLSGMFNESIFSYPGSRVHDLKVAIVEDDQHQETLQLDGHLRFLMSVPFTMFTHLSVDPATHDLVIDVDHLKVFGGIPATKILHWTPLSLDRLIALPPNKSLSVQGNRILVKPLGLFPPPRIAGVISNVEVREHAIRITFAGEPIPAPKSTALNYVYLSGGTSRFGAFRMVNTDILILDATPKDPFRFSLADYAARIPASTIVLPDMKSVQITMRDR